MKLDLNIGPHFIEDDDFLNLASYRISLRELAIKIILLKDFMEGRLNPILDGWGRLPCVRLELPLLTMMCIHKQHHHRLLLHLILSLTSPFPSRSIAEPMSLTPCGPSTPEQQPYHGHYRSYLILVNRSLNHHDGEGQ